MSDLRTMPTEQAEDLIASDRDLAHAIGTAMLSSALPETHYSLAMRCAAYLSYSGWEVTRCRRGTKQGCQRKQLNRLRKDAVRQLQRVGILPSGLAWWLVPLLRWAIVKYLSHLIWEWLLDE